MGSLVLHRNLRDRHSGIWRRGNEDQRDLVQCNHGYLVIRTSCGETWPQTLNRNFFLRSGRRWGEITEGETVSERFLLDEQKSSHPYDVLWRMAATRRFKRDVLYICICVWGRLCRVCVSRTDQRHAPVHFLLKGAAPQTETLLIKF